MKNEATELSKYRHDSEKLKGRPRKWSGGANKVHLGILALLAAIFIFFIVDGGFLGIRIIAGVMLAVGGIIWLIRSLWDIPYDDTAFPTEPDPLRNKYYSVFYGSKND